MEGAPSVDRALTEPLSEYLALNCRTSTLWEMVGKAASESITPRRYSSIISCVRQDDCKVFFYPLMVSLSNHRWLVWASFDKLRMSRNR